MANNNSSNIETFPELKACSYHKIFEKKLIESEQKFQNLVDLAAVPIAITNFRGRLTYVNEALANLLGYTVDEMMGQSFKEFIHPKDRGRIMRLFFNIIILPRQPRVLEFRAVKKDGNIVNLLSKPTKLVINRKIIGFQAIIIDITVQKKTEKELEKSKEENEHTSTFIHEILSKMSDYVLIIDEDYNLKYLNDSAKKAYGNYIEKKCYQILSNRSSPCHRSGMPCEINEIIQKGKTYFEDIRPVIAIDRITHVHAKPFTMPDGKRAVISVARDITEQKLTENVLRKSEENHKRTLTFLGNILHNMSDIVSVIDENYKFSFLNEAAKKLYGNVVGEKCFKILRDLKKPCHQSNIKCYVHELLEKDTTHFSDIRQAGETGKILHIQATPIIGVNNKKSILSVSRDVTEERNLKEKMERTLSLLNATIESSPDSILVVDQNHKITNYNKKWVDTFAVPKQIISSSDDCQVMEFLTGKIKDPTNFEKRTAELFSNPDQESMDVFEWDDGRIFERYSKPQRLKNKTIGRVISIRDITERKMAEKNLRDSEEFNSSLMENSLNPILVINTDTSIRYVNPALEKLTEYSKLELIGTKPPFPWWDKDVIKETSTRLEENMQRGLTHYEENFKTKNGKNFWVEINAKSIIKDGELKHYLSMWVDITQRKLMENKLRAYSDHLTELVEEKSRELAISERFLKTTIDSIPDLMYIKESNLKYVLVNDSYSKFQGKLKEEILNGSVYDLYPKEMADIFESQDRQVFEKGMFLHTSEIPLKDSNGTIHRIYTIKAPLKDSNGKVTHLLGIGRDITQLQQAEEQLERIYNLSLDMICVADLNGNFTKVNPAFEEVLGYTQQELLSKPFLDFIHPEDQKWTIHILSDKLAKGLEVIDFQNRYRCKNGSYKWLSWTAKPIPAEGIMIAVARDITEYKKLEMLKEQIISTTTHELRTPLVSILAYLNLAISGKLGTLNKNLENGLQIVNRNANRLLNITNDLLDIKRIESGKLQLNLEVLDFREIVENSTREIQPLIREKEQTLHVEYPDSSLLIKGDKVRISQVLMNLLGNANKFTPKRGTITLRVIKTKKAIKVKISDTGIGIKKEDIKRIFTPFANIQKASEIKGTGLGLSVTKGLVRAHGGTIKAESDGENKGATFTFTLLSASK